MLLFFHSRGRYSCTCEHDRLVQNGNGQAAILWVLDSLDSFLLQPGALLSLGPGFVLPLALGVDVVIQWNQSRYLSARNSSTSTKN